MVSMRKPLTQSPARPIQPVSTDVNVNVDGGVLPGILTVPPHAIGSVVFAHDSGSDRSNPRDRRLACVLNDYGVATLLIDLLTGSEHQLEHLACGNFDIGLQGDRLVEAIDWLESQPDLEELPIGIFGASTGAAVGLRAAAARAHRVVAVVCRGGRADLAEEALPLVAAPTLFIVGAEDDRVLNQNRHSAQKMHCERRVQVVPGARLRVARSGTLDEATRLAREWFLRHLGIRLH